MPGSETMGMDMTEQTARAEDAAAPAEAAPLANQPGPTQPDPEAHAADLKDRLLRTLAEMENLRKRTAREIADSRAYAVAAFARDVLGVAESGVKALIEGVELTERELQKALEKNGVSQFTPRGEKFDPNVHQAMFEVPDAAVPAGSVVEVVQPGYMIGERMLRPALVGVSKGGPKTAPARGQAAVNDNAAKAAKDS